jgi:hypothetical protein
MLHRVARSWGHQNAITPGSHLRRRQPAVPMRSRKDANGTVVGTAFIEIEPHRDHALQNRIWRLNTMNSRLLAGVSDRPMGDSEPRRGKIGLIESQLYVSHVLDRSREHPVGLHI